MTGRIVGLVLVAFAVWLVLPATGRRLRREREYHLDLMPWVRRIPGAEFLSSEPVQRIVRSVIATCFGVVGLLLLIGVTKLN